VEESLPFQLLTVADFIRAKPETMLLVVFPDFQSLYVDCSLAFIEVFSPSLLFQSFSPSLFLTQRVGDLDFVLPPPFGRFLFPFLALWLASRQGFFFTKIPFLPRRFGCACWCQVGI